MTGKKRCEDLLRCSFIAVTVAAAAIFLPVVASAVRPEPCRPVLPGQKKSSALNGTIG